MTVYGIMTLDGSEVGSFELNNNGHIVVNLNKEDETILDVLEFATENGMTLELTLKPEFDGYVPQHLS